MSSSTLQRTVFLDCEFTDLVNPKLLSIGLVADDGRECYAELAGEAHLAQASLFVHDMVVPQFGLIPHAETSQLSIGKRVGNWLLSMEAPCIDVCYDYHADMDLLEAALRSASLWASLSGVLQPVHVGYLLEDPLVEHAMEKSWAASFWADRIERHHAVADARALKAGYAAMHGAP